MRLRTGAVATALLGATGCAVSTEPSGMLMSLTPDRAYNDVAFTLELTGGPYRPAFAIDTTGGTGTVDVTGFSFTLRPSGGGEAPAITATEVTWSSEKSLLAEIPAGLPAGIYDAELRDPRGETVPRAGAFRSLGADEAAPLLTLVAPSAGTLLGEETMQTFQFEADDGDGWIGGMHWHLWTDAVEIGEGDCVPPQVHKATCAPTVRLPTAATRLDVVNLLMTVGDRAQPMTGTRLRQFGYPLAPAPTVLTGGCVPTSGPAAGGTIVTISGSNFVAAQRGTPETGTEIVIKEKDEAGNKVLPQRDGATATLLSAEMPPHGAGPVSLIVRNGKQLAPACTFSFIPAPVIRAVSPHSGPASGGTRVVIAGNHFPPGVTVSLIGDINGGTGGELLCLERVSESRLEGIMPPGTGPVGLVVDAGPVGKSAVRDGEFSYDESGYVYPGPPPDCTGGSAP